jgi:citronellol/citronellal dehydrogenase
MDEPHAKAGMTDAEFATHPTVYAADALKGQVVMVSGGSGGIGRAIAWLSGRLEPMSSWSGATRQNSTPSSPI